jgi:hypothetical protein
VLIREGEHLSVELHPNGRAKVPITIWRRGTEDTVVVDAVDVVSASARARFVEELPEDVRVEAAKLLTQIAIEVMRHRVSAEAGEESVREHQPPAISPDELRRLAAPVLEAPSVLDLVGRYARQAGYAGDGTPVLLVYLGLTSRLLERPINLAITGPSSGGKNYTSRVVFPLFPDTAYRELSGMSPLALVYCEEPLKHRVVVVSEASALHTDGVGASLLRGLVWDNALRYETVIDGEHVVLEKDGPTGLITTTTGEIDKELATRLWEVPIADDVEQTRKVLRAIGRAVDGSPTVRDEALPPVEVFVAAQQWLATAGSVAVVVPYATTLSDLITPDEVRLRRDFTQLLTMIRVHALLHQCGRERDGEGRIVATFDDYAVIRELVEPVFRGSVSSGVTAQVRETIAAVKRLVGDGGEKTITVTELASALGLTPSGAWHRARKPLRKRWLVNAEPRKGHPARLRVGEALPEEREALPTVETLIERDALMREATS